MNRLPFIATMYESEIISGSDIINIQKELSRKGDDFHLLQKKKDTKFKKTIVNINNIKTVVDSIDDLQWRINSMIDDGSNRYKDNVKWYENEISIINSLVDKIKKGVNLNPIVLDKQFNVLDGEHRLAAYKQTKISEIPAYLEI